MTDAVVMEDEDPQALAAMNAADTGVPPKKNVEEPAEEVDEKQREIDNLRAQIERHKLEAQQARAVAANVEQQSQTSVVDSQYLAVKNLQQTKAAEIALVKNALRAAREAGDIDKETEQFTLLGELVAQKVAIENSLGQFEAQRKQQQTAPRQMTQTERLLEQVPAGRGREWLRAHPECLAGGPMHNRAMRAHWDALDQGYAEGSDEYFAHIEDQVGGGQRQPARTTTVQPAAPQRQPSYSAPVTPRQPSSGNTSTRNNGRSISIDFGPSTLETIEALGMDRQEYAKIALEEIAAGRAKREDYAR